MTISSRTPEGEPSRCPVCGAASAVEISDPPGDACCPACGHLLWVFRDRVGNTLGVAAEAIMLETALDEGADSIDMVELVMELEEEFDINISDDAASETQTIADAKRWIRRHRDGQLGEGA